MLIVTWEFTGYNMTILLTSLTNVLIRSSKRPRSTVAPNCQLPPG